MQEHSLKLIEKLSHDTNLLSKSADADNKIGSEDDELDHDLTELLKQYEIKLQLKRNLLLNSLEANKEKEFHKLNQSFQRKDDVHSSLFQDLQRQVNCY